MWASKRNKVGAGNVKGGKGVIRVAGTLQPFGSHSARKSVPDMGRGEGTIRDALMPRPQSGKSP